MSQYKELKVRLRNGHINASFGEKDAAAEAIESLERQLAAITENRDWWISEHANQVARTNEEIHLCKELERQLATITAQRDLLKDLVKEVEGKYFAFLKEKGIDAEKFKAEGDMYGWNFHTGERSGAVWMHLFMTELLKAASLKGE